MQASAADAGAEPDGEAAGCGCGSAVACALYKRAHGASELRDAFDLLVSAHRKAGAGRHAVESSSRSRHLRQSGRRHSAAACDGHFGQQVCAEQHDLRAEDIHFSYGEKPIIHGITLDIPERTTTAIVGPSGSGKTTLCQLLSRFWDVDTGSVTLGGYDVRKYNMDSLMRNFSFVFQNVYLLHDTIANNIRFGSRTRRCRPS